MSQQAPEPAILRYSEMTDVPHLTRWLLEPTSENAFPMQDLQEAEDSAKNWVGFCRYRASLTAEINGEPVGIATLGLMPYKRISHQCLLSIIVSQDHQNKGIGTLLINNIISLAKEYFKIEVLYLEVYEHNPAIRLYKRFGFREVGKQPYFMKNAQGEYLGKLIMERVL